MCEAFDENPALIAAREADSVDDFVARVVEFWAAEEKVLVQLYGAASVDPAASDLVVRQRRDRHAELRRLLRGLGIDDRRAFASLSLLTSFETFEELRRHAGLPLREVTRTIQEAARLLLS